MNIIRTSALIACATFFGSVTAYADDLPNAPIPYAEFAVGASFTPTVRTDDYVITIGADTAAGHIDLNYNTGFTVGAEFGYAGVISPDLRLGVAYEFNDAKFSDGLITGTVNGVPGSLPFVRAETKALGLSLDNTVHLVTGQATYSLPMVGPIRPYLGAGAGIAIISHTDSQFAFTATAGFRSSLGDNAYWGVRYRFYWINGPTDNLGIRYQPIMNHSVMVLVGTYLD